MKPDDFRCEVTTSDNDKFGNRVTLIKCRGRLVGSTANEIKDAVKPLIPLGGRILIDLGAVDYLDSSGLGALVGLKVSAIKQGYCLLEYTEMTPRILELLKISNLTQLFSAKTA